MIIGEDEIKEGIYKVKVLNEEKEVVFRREELVEGVKELI
jgi:histidyl-tRNA synthetase